MLRTVCLYEMMNGTKDLEFFGLYETASTLKDVKSIAKIALGSGQTWDMETQTKYMANSITSVKVSRRVVSALLKITSVFVATENYVCLSLLKITSVSVATEISRGFLGAHQFL